MTIANYVSLSTRRWSYYQTVAIFCALSAFGASIFAQDLAVAENQSDWLAREIFLRRAIESSDTEQKRDALLQIRNLRNEAASRLAVPALSDKSEIVRTTAAFSVIFLPRDEAAIVLLPLLGDKKELVRREAALALGKVGNSNAVTQIVRTMQKDKIPEVRAAAAIALGEISDVSAIAYLTTVLQNKSKTEEEFVRRSAARSIGQIAQIIQTGDREVLTPEDFPPVKSSRFNHAKYQKLIETYPMFRPANDRLIEILQSSGEAADVKREAAFALGAIGDKSAIPVLQANSKAKDYYLAEISKEALYKIQFARDKEP